MLDASIDAGAAAAQYSALLAKREGKTWADSDDAITVENRFDGAVENEVYVPPTGTDNISVPYLPDPAAPARARAQHPRADGSHVASVPCR